MQTKLLKSANNCNHNSAKTLKRVHFILSSDSFNTSLNVFSYSLSSVIDKESVNIPISLNQVFKVIKDEPKATHNKIEKYAHEYLLASEGETKNKYKELMRAQKLQLPFFLLSGYQPRGHNKEEIEYNGAIQIDIDIKEINGKEKALEYKQKLIELPFIALCCISPSSYGVKAIVPTTNKDKEKHKFYASSIARLISEICNIPLKYFDNLCYSQACFVPSDEKVHINEQARALAIEHDQTKDSDYSIYIECEQPKKAKEPKPTPTLNPVELKKPLESVLVKRACEKALEIAKKENTHRTHIARAYASLTLSFAVEHEQALKYLSEHEPTFEQKHIETAKDIYRRYFENFGTNRFKLFDSVEKIESKYKLKKGEKLASCGIMSEFLKGENLLMESGTGTGKTFAWSTMKMPKVLVVLTQALVEEVCHKYGATPFYANEAEITAQDTSICTTYKSFARLTNKINASRFTVFVDECHNTTSARYIANDLTSVLGSLHAYKNFHFMTATPLLNSHPTIERLKRIKALELEPQKRIFSFCYYKDSLFLAVLDRVLKNKKEGTQSAILFNNTQDKTGRLHDLTELFNRYGLKCAIINSTTKETTNFAKLIMNADSREFDVIISTSILKEGNSIEFHPKKVECLIIGNFHASVIEQFSARFRQLLIRYVVIFKNIKNEHEQARFLFNRFVEEEREQQKLHKMFVENTLKRKSTPKDEKIRIIKGYKTGKEYCIDIEEESNFVEINELKLSMYAHDMETNSMNLDSTFMSAYLNLQYNWNEQEPSYFFGKESKLKKEENKRKREENKKMRQESWLAMVEQVRDTSDLTTIQANTLAEKKILRDIREKIEFLEKYYETKEKALDILAPKDKEPLDTKNKFQKLKSQLLITTAKNAVEIYGAICECSIWIKEIDTELKQVEILSSTHALAIVNRANRKIGLKDSTQKKALDIIKCFCKIERSTKRRNGKKENIYKIIDHNPTALEIKIPFEYQENKQPQNVLSDAEWQEIANFYGL